MAEPPLNVFIVVLYRMSQSTGDESRLRSGWRRRSAASQCSADECGKARSALALSYNYINVFSLAFRMCLQIFAAIWQSFS